MPVSGLAVSLQNRLNEWMGDPLMKDGITAGVPGAALVRATVNRAQRQLGRISLRRKLTHTGAYGVALALNSVASDWGLGHGYGAAGAVACCLLAVFAAILWHRAERPSLLTAARMIDRRAGLNDRLVSAWQFLESDHNGAAHRLAIEDAAAHLIGVDVVRLVSLPTLPVPWRAAGLLVGASAFVLVPLAGHTLVIPAPASLATMWVGAPPVSGDVVELSRAVAARIELLRRSGRPEPGQLLFVENVAEELARVDELLSKPVVDRSRLAEA